MPEVPSHRHLQLILHAKTIFTSNSQTYIFSLTTIFFSLTYMQIWFPHFIGPCQMSISTADDLGSVCQGHSKTREAACWVVGCQDWLVLGHYRACPVPCEAHPLVFQVVPTVVLPTTFNSNHGLFSLKVKCPWGTHGISPSFCVFHQVCLCLWQKGIPGMGLAFHKGGAILTAFPSHFPTCTMGSLSVPTVCKCFIWAAA